MLRGLEGSAIESEVTVSETALARLSVRIHVAQQDAGEPNIAGLQSQLADAVRTWHDRLRETLLLQLPEERALRLLHAYGENFSAAYQEEVDTERASRDILKVALIHDGGSELRARLLRAERAIPAATAPYDVPARRSPSVCMSRCRSSRILASES